MYAITIVGCLVLRESADNLGIVCNLNRTEGG